MVKPLQDKNKIAAYIILNKHNDIIHVSETFSIEYGYTIENIKKNILGLLNGTDDNLNILNRPIKTRFGQIAESVIIRVKISNDRTMLFFSKDSKKIFRKFEHKIDKITDSKSVNLLENSLNMNAMFLSAFVEIKDLDKIASFYGDDFANNIIIDISNLLKNVYSKKNIFIVNKNTFCILEHKKYALSQFKVEVESRLKQIVFTRKQSIELDYVLGFAEGNGNKIFRRSRLALEYAKYKKLLSYTFNKEEHSKNKFNYRLEIDNLTTLRNAIKSEDIIPFYQPIYCNHDKKIKKFECLARMKKDDEYLTPVSFIDLAKKYSLDAEISKNIIRKSFEYFKDKNEFQFTINLTSQTIQDTNMFYFILDAVDSFPHPENICFEIVESEEIPLELLEKDILIVELRKRKCKFALDDFGSGYSNLKILSEFKYDFLKIDGSLISNISRSQTYSTVKAIVALAHANNIKVVAEWVKDKETQEIIEELNIDYSQGYYFGKPEMNISCFF